MSADNTYTARLERLRNRTLAIFHSRNPTLRELGATPMDESTRQQRRLGQVRLVIQPPEGPSYTVDPCCQTTCSPVCPVSTLEENTPFLFPVSIGDSGFQDFINDIYGTSTPIPDPPVDYSESEFIVLLYPSYCNSTSQTVHVLSDSAVVPSQITDLGPSPPIPDSPFPDGLGGAVIIYPSAGFTNITLTASNSCSSSTGNAQFFCFLAGSPVTMADGTTKPIETVAVGDRVVGAFSEINTVTGTLSSNLGFVSITNINGEHKTTAPHPHIAADHKFCCTDPLTLTKFAYGKSFPLRGEDGKLEARVIKGVNPDRITKLEVGTILQTQTGPRTVTALENIRMPPSTRVYHLTTDGSHSYLVDGYAVAGGATEEDFDYDTWTPRA